VQGWIQDIWWGGRPAPLWLRGLARLFGAVAALRRAAYRRGWLPSGAAGRPVVIVGNITVGGSGKTPLVIWLARTLAARGLKVGIVLRGYRSKAASVAAGVRRVRADSPADEVGDEALLIARRSGVPVYVGRDRLAAARALAREGVDLILADDGLQHYRLRREVEIAVVDAARGAGNGRLLPAGPLREPASRLDRVSVVVQTGSGAHGRAGALVMRLAGDQLLPLDGAGEPLMLGALAGQRVHAVAGIGNPGRFFGTLRAAGLEPLPHPFPDHHAYVASDLEFGDALPVLMTEKDAVKCRPFARAGRWCLPVDAEFSAADASALLGRIAVDTRLLDILACPQCKGPLQHARAAGVLVCRADRLAFPIRDGIPVLLENEARVLPPGDPLLER
jgi:tetraacyldisaccharide 4'-kinase